MRPNPARRRRRCRPILLCAKHIAMSKERLAKPTQASVPAPVGVELPDRPCVGNCWSTCQLRCWICVSFDRLLFAINSICDRDTPASRQFLLLRIDLFHRRRAVERGQAGPASRETLPKPGCLRCRGARKHRQRARGPGG